MLDFSKPVVKYSVIVIPGVIIAVAIIYISALFNNHKKEVESRFSAYNKTLMQQLQLQHDEAIAKDLSEKNDSAKAWMQHAVSDFEHVYQEAKLKLKDDLQEAMDMALVKIRQVKKTNNKNKSIQDVTFVLSKLNDKLKTADMFLVDFNGNTLYGNNNKPDVEGRSIILEQIQKVRRRGSGYLVSTIDNLGTLRHILVQDLAMHDLFIGVNVYEKGNNTEVKNQILSGMKNIVLDQSDCIFILEGDREIYATSSCPAQKTEKNVISQNYKPFNWTLNYIYDNTKKLQQESQKLKSFESNLKSSLI